MPLYFFGIVPQVAVNHATCFLSECPSMMPSAYVRNMPTCPKSFELKNVAPDNLHDRFDVMCAQSCKFGSQEFCTGSRCLSLGRFLHGMCIAFSSDFVINGILVTQHILIHCYVFMPLCVYMSHFAHDLVLM